MGAESSERVGMRPAGYLVADEALHRLPVAAPEAALLVVPQGASATEMATARTWTRYGGLLAGLVVRVRLDPALAVAVMCVESGGEAFGPDGRPTIRFESHIFRRGLAAGRLPAFDRRFRIGGSRPWLGHSFRPTARAPWTAFHGSQRLEWRAYEVACGIDEDAATRAISVGLAQVMGFNHALVGYVTPQAMLSAMSRDVRYQVIALFDFIAGPSGTRAALAALRAEDFERFASIYNGAGQARHYAGLIEAHAGAFRRLAPAPLPSVAADEAHRYVVQPGDTLSAIARRAGTTVAALARSNDIERVDVILAGQVIFTPRRLA